MRRTFVTACLAAALVMSVATPALAAPDAKVATPSRRIAQTGPARSKIGPMAVLSLTYKGQIDGVTGSPWTTLPWTRLDVEKTTAYRDSSGNAYVDGVFSNQTSQNAQTFLTAVYFYDASDQLITWTYDLGAPHALGPTELGVFDMWVQVPTNATSYAVTCDGLVNPGGIPVQDLTVPGGAKSRGVYEYELKGSGNNAHPVAFAWEYRGSVAATGSMLDTFIFPIEYTMPINDDNWVTLGFNGLRNWPGSSPTVGMSFAGQSLSGHPTFVRRSGASRYDTANYLAGSMPSASTALLASGQGFADALSAAALAGYYRGPLYLTPQAGLAAGTLAMMQQQGVTSVIIIGGEAAVSDTVRQQLADAGLTVDRIAGSSRYETSAMVALRLKSLGVDSKRFILARGDAFADALSATPLSYAARVPILLTKPSSLPTVTASAIASLAPDRAWVVGGTGAVSKAVADGLGVGYSRLAGKNRYETCAWCADFGFSLGILAPRQWAVASGASFPDALVAGMVAGRSSGPLILSPKASPDKSLTGFVSYFSWQERSVVLAGGTGALTSDCGTMWGKTFGGVPTPAP